MAPHVDGTYLLDYKWIVVIAAFGAFYTAWGIGANDLANSFGTSVGSKTLKIWQACVIAAIFEFLGAFFLGSTVVDTVSSKIANVTMFANRPELYMYGMMCVDYSSAIWIMIATMLELPVSTTHSTVGGVIGFSLVNAGRHGVLWNDYQPTFPYRKGVTPIVISWFTSPIIAGVFAGCLFFIVRLLILRRKNSLLLGMIWVPFIFFGVVFCNIILVIQKGAKFIIDEDTKPFQDKCKSDLAARKTDPSSRFVKCLTAPTTKKLYYPYGSMLYRDPGSGLAPTVAPYNAAFPSNATTFCCSTLSLWEAKGWTRSSGPAALAASLVFVITIVWVWLWVRPRIAKWQANEDQKAQDLADGKLTKVEKTESSDEDLKALDRIKNSRVIEVPHLPAPKMPSPFTWSSYMQFNKEWFKWYWIVTVFPALKKLTNGLFYDIHAITSKDNDEFDEVVYNMHQLMEKFDPATEKLFEYLQVFSACAMSFAHGANDVANAIGPFAGVWSAYKFKRLNPKNANIGEDMRWILGLGGAGIVIGLATYGHIIMRGLGVKLASITPSRGFCMETCTGITVTFASAYGLPVSTTHCQVGSTSGAGVVENWRTGLNWRYLGKAFVGWVITLIFTGHICAALYSQGAYAPSVYMVVDRVNYQDSIGGSQAMLLSALQAVDQNTVNSLLSATGYTTTTGTTAGSLIAAAKSTAQLNNLLNLYRISSTTTNGTVSAVVAAPVSATGIVSATPKTPFRLNQYFKNKDEVPILYGTANTLMKLLTALKTANVTCSAPTPATP